MRIIPVARMIALLLVVVVPGTALGQPVMSPSTAPPRFAVVSSAASNEGIIALLETRSIVVEAQGEPRVIVDVSAVQRSLKDCRIWTAGGKEIPLAEAVKRLKPGQTVLLSAHGQKPDAAFLRVLKADTLILVESLRKPGPP